MPPTRIVCGLDVGTTKACAVVAEITADAGIALLGIGESGSHGLRQGNMVDLEATVESIHGAIARAEQMAGVAIRDVYAGVAGDHLRSINSRGVIAVSGRDNEVTPEDLQRVVEAARALAIPSSRAILHVIPQGFIVDDQSGIQDPVGMSGVRLEAEVHIITSSSSAVRNLARAVERAGYRIEELVAAPLASSWAVLEEDERRLGVVLLDIGAGTTDLAVYFDGSVQHTAVLGMGGAQITNDIAIGLRTPLEMAEQIKLEHGCACTSLVSHAGSIEIPGVGGRPARTVGLSVLSAIIEPRVEEILSLAREEIGRLQGAEMLAAGIVITGGTAGLRGVTDLAERVFEMPARVGAPRDTQGVADLADDPRYATGFGLVRYGATQLGRANGANAWPRGTSRFREWIRSHVPFMG
ncbi:MAG: cell division protein FtsA [Candidatus Eisenbacteria bacterium]|nr:cell division protein FtsA [Candidatus Eisenbacteria bacterium]